MTSASSFDPATPASGRSGPQDGPSPQDPVVTPAYGVDLTAKDPTERALWDLAVRRLKAKQEFRNHLVTYVLVNTFLVVLWAVTDAGFFWPIFPILGWGLGLGLHAWTTYGPSVATQDQIEREMDRLRPHL